MGTLRIRTTKAYDITKSLEDFTEKLQDNIRAEERVENRIYDIRMRNWAYDFYSNEKNEQLKKEAIELKNRILRLRKRILNQMQCEINNQIEAI